MANRKTSHHWHYKSSSCGIINIRQERYGWVGHKRRCMKCEHLLGLSDALLEQKRAAAIKGAAARWVGR